MKKKYHLLILIHFALLFSACTKEDALTAITGESVKLNFKVDVENFKVETRASQNINENKVENLYVLVFDEDGSFMARREANISNPQQFSVELPSSNNKRILHFIANYNWANFNDSKALHKNEGEILPLLHSNNLLMWNRTELANGINVSSLSNRTISLVRNMAKITVQIDNNPETQDFDPEEFTVFNSPTIGTIVPFDPSDYTFPIGKITVPSAVEYNQQHAYENLKSSVLNPIYIFERNNSQVLGNGYTCIVIRGRYKDEHGNVKDSYYKIDIIEIDDHTKEVKRLNIERNYWYKLTIKKVKREGYATESEALQNAAGNNSSIDVVIERYPVIADKKSKLAVEKTLVLVTEDNFRLTTWVKYYPNSKENEEENSNLAVHLQEGDPNRPVFKTPLAISTGVIEAYLSNPPSDGSTRMAKIFVSKGDLSRVIRVMLRKPYNLSATLNGYNQAAYVAPPQESKAELKFKIPHDYPDDLLPLEVNIYTEELYPAQSGLKLSMEKKKVCYTYTTREKGEHKILFKSNLSSRPGKIKVEANCFTTVEISYQTY